MITIRKLHILISVIKLNEKFVNKRDPCQEPLDRPGVLDGQVEGRCETNERRTQNWGVKLTRDRLY